MFLKDLVGSSQRPSTGLIGCFLMEKWESNRKKIDRYEDGVLLNIKKKIVRESADTNN